MSDLFRMVDIGIANEEDCQAALGIHADVDVSSGQLECGRLSRAGRKSVERLSRLEDAGHHAARIQERVAQRLVGLPARSAGSLF